MLSADKLQLFTASLQGLPAEEIRKAKLLYVRNAISEHHARLEQHRGFGCLQLAFAVIPFFWPFLFAQRRALKAAARLSRERIENAVLIWKDDLAGESFMLEGQPLG